MLAGRSAVAGAAPTRVSAAAAATVMRRNFGLTGFLLARCGQRMLTDAGKRHQDHAGTVGKPS
ncbi:hypothetical protein GCM10027436_08770 [Actinophytocola sediminis]